ncbi:hypothetical protein [Myroides fluvii]|uniref:hypothetical protein n=1 Tax=Myroides fluvii TaxID=2572594 RepID=UPI00131A6529|nr:hypothetical protein [Myroides fluvii]
MSINGIYKGKKVRISLGGKTLYHANSCKVDISTELEEIATKDTDGKMSVPDGYSWSASTEALVADKPLSSTQVDAMDIIDYQLAGTELDFEFTTNEEGDFLLKGKVIVSQASVDASRGAAVKGSFSFVGQGDLVREKVV